VSRAGVDGMLPTLFLSHGAPNVALHDLPARRFFDGLAESLPRPRAIVVVSAHYERAGPAVTTASAPRTIHDFSGFEPALYEIRYPAPGDPRLAEEIIRLLASAGFPAARGDADWGLDHGAWTPLCRIFPAADLPVVALSLMAGAGPAEHLALGEAVAGLRRAGILVLGSGSISHNLGRLRPPMTAGDAEAWVTDFVEWCAARLAADDRAALVDYRRQAPYAALNHPTEEHLLPLFVALGAAGPAARASRLHHSLTYTNLAMDAYRFD
jgi:4,5-DOPA dioxygenase extradiol